MGLAVLCAAQYRGNPGGRCVFLPLEPKLEREIAKRLLKVYRRKIVLRYGTEEHSELYRKTLGIYKEIQGKFKLLPGKLYLLSTSEEVLKGFPTGDFFISRALAAKDEVQLYNMISHELSHIYFSHSQEHLSYAKPMSLLVSWLARHNHHTTQHIKDIFLLEQYNWTQEEEAQKFTAKLLSKDLYTPNYVCSKVK